MRLMESEGKKVAAEKDRERRERERMRERKREREREREKDKSVLQKAGGSERSANFLP